MKCHHYFGLRACILPVLILMTRFAAPGQGAPDVRLDGVITSGLSEPVQVVNAGDGTGRLFIVQQGGTIKVFNRINDASFSDQGVFFQISGIPVTGEQGLLSLAFHPQFSTNRRFYVYYTNAQNNLEVASYQTGVDPNRFDPATGQILLTIPHPTYTNHNGGEMHFGADGMLYLSVGDGGGAGDPGGNAQDLSKNLGKILRIDVNRADLRPEDNPFPNSLVYALGLRNPFRWSFDRQTRAAWIGDVGQGRFEEINAVSETELRGANFGWDCLEGNSTYTAGCSAPANYFAPVHTYATGSEGQRSVIGGVVYRGAAFPNLNGYYIGADYFGSQLHLIRQTGTTYSFTPDDVGVTGISDLGEAENGEIYAVSRLTNILYRVEEGPPLPVKFASFSVSRSEDNSADIQWRVSASSDFSSFELQRSDNAREFTVIANIPRKDTGEEFTNYSFTDATVQPDRRYYYRLRVLDNDGSFEFSQIAAFYSRPPVTGLDPSTGETRFVRPTIIESGELQIYLQEPFDELQLIGLSGQCTHKIALGLRTGQLRINPGPIPAGLYLARFTNNRKVVTEKIIFP